MELGNLVIATAATPQDGTVSSITQGVPYAPAAHFDLVHAAYHAADAAALSRGLFLGPIVSADLFYDPEEDPQDLWHSLGVLAVEMEAAAIFTLAAMHGARAGCLLTVSNLIGRENDVYVGSEALKDAVDDMMILALEALDALN
jgi:purine-nucleoside phosphorylase